MIDAGVMHVRYGSDAMNRTQLLLVILLALSLIKTPRARCEEFFVGSWNLENLFDTEDDPDVKLDEDYTPDSPKHWTPERLEIKLKNQASAISKMKDGHGPDVLGMCEVENRKVVEMLVEKLKPLGRKYEIVHKDSPSDRGIDCALIFDSSVFTLADSKFHYVEAEHTRDILEAKLRRNGKDLFVFMDHWPSRRNDEWQRLAAADVLRKRVDEVLAADPKADIIMLGDFNDESDNISIRDHLRAAATQEKLPPAALFDTTAYIRAAGKGTFVYKNKWDLLDHVIISPGLLDSSGYHWKPGSSQRLELSELFYQPHYPDAVARPSASYTENDFHKNGYSDHLPVGCVIEQ
jgi:endonuclease/exonuclease/phosphatase family metal-dependent hydrolase